MIPKPLQSKRTKRAATNETSVGHNGGGKRQRALPDNQASSSLTPVNAPSIPTQALPSHPFYPYPSTPVHPLAPPFSTTPIYQNPYHAYMTPAPPPMLYYPAYTHPNTPTPMATPANSHVTQTSQPSSGFEFRHYNPGWGGSSRYTGNSS